MTPSDSIQRGHAVLDWNRRHLRRDSPLTEAIVGECFAEQFVVAPNGRHYQADRALYLDFLNEMKSTLERIDYQVQHTVADERSVVFSMRALLYRPGGVEESFEAMLMMAFDAEGKVTLWRELYLPSPR